MNGFFSQDGPLMTGMNTLTAVVELNILVLLCSLPIVTAGASFAAMHYVIMQLREGTEGRISRTFFRQFRANLRTAVPVWLILLVLFVFCAVDYRIVVQTEEIPDAFLVPICLLGLLGASVAVYAFPLTAKFENTVRATLRNAAILAVAHLPGTVGMLLIHAACLFLFTMVPPLLPLLFLSGISLPAYLSSRIYWPVLKKLIPEEDA